MAASESVTAPVAEVHTVGDDDDAWLYGDEDKEKEGANNSQDKSVSGGKGDQKAPTKGVTVKKEDREEGEMSGEEGESQEKDDDDDSDDDNVQVTIGDIKAWSASEQQPRSLFKSGSTYQKPATGTPAKPATTTKGLDIDAQGTINGIPVYEFDLSSIENEEKPWRKPGADITDYFNYGFTEETWQQYCEKQRRLMAMNDGAPKTVTQNNISIVSRADKDLGAVSRPRIQPMPLVKPQVGTIDVIGATAKDSRRPDEGDPIPVAGVASHIGRKFMPVPGLPPTSIPPPHLPPVDYSIPPPGMPPPHPVPPPGMAVPPPGFPPVPNPYDPFYAVPPPPDRSMPPPGFDDRPPFTYGGPSLPTYSSTFSESSRPSGSQQWESGSTMSEQDSRDRDWDRERERRESSRRERERSPSHRLEEDFSREAKYRSHERDRERERERDRDRERERDRDRKRDREGRRRSRSAERERESESRRERDEDKHRSRRSDSRRHKGEDSDTESRSSSKHKKSRRRRDKDEDGAEGDEASTKGD